MKEITGPNFNKMDVNIYVCRGKNKGIGSVLGLKLEIMKKASF